MTLSLPQRGCLPDHSPPSPDTPRAASARLPLQGVLPITFQNPHATPYAFPAGKDRALTEYLTENTEYDPASGCLLWTGSIRSNGSIVAIKAIASKQSTRQVTRLAWMLHHGRKLDKSEQLVRTCGNPKCIHPEHLKVADAADLWEDPDLPRKRQGSVGALKVGNRTLSAQEVYHLQTTPPPRDPSLGLPAVFSSDIGCWANPRTRWVDLRARHLARLEIIRAVRRCPIKATRSVLPCGFIRYDLLPEVTEIAFTPPPPEQWEPTGWSEDDWEQAEWQAALPASQGQSTATIPPAELEPQAA